jgi:60 kDa SS-A/Ro ribonucleoprotein
MSTTRSYTRHYNPKVTPQSEPIPGSKQVANSAGGYSWHVDDWMRLDRFLVLGSEKGTYYITEQKLTRDNAEALVRCLDANGKKAIDRIVEISVQGRAVKQGPTLFALALACRHKDEATRTYARSVIPKVARTGTHLFNLVAAIDATGGWGRGTRRAIGEWYKQLDPEDLAYQLVKYPSRDGWSHRDVLRKTHVEVDEVRSAMLGWATADEPMDWGDTEPSPDDVNARLWARDRAMKLDVDKADDLKMLVRLIEEYRLPRECLPTQGLQHAEVWEALLKDMPVHALVRNLGKLTEVGVLSPMSANEKRVISLLSDAGRIQKSRLHPLSVLVALNTYRMGHGVRGSLKWEPVPRVVDALDEAFYMTFKTITPANKRTMLGIDVSGSMGSPELAGLPGITPRVGAAVMAMVTARLEPEYHFFGFCHQFVQLPITAKMTLDQVIGMVYKQDFGGTDCALPMMYALKTGLEVDTFCVYTDSETWAGGIHPSQALREYRQKTGFPAKLVVVGMTSNEFTIADPDDAGMMDVVGFDTAAPSVIADFSRGEPDVEAEA